LSLHLFLPKNYNPIFLTFLAATIRVSLFSHPMDKYQSHKENLVFLYD
jgi:hypothetical protein